MNGRKKKQGRGAKAGRRRKKWRKEKLGWERERERGRGGGEKFGEWRLASGKVEPPFRLEGKRYLVVSCLKIVEKDRKSSRAFDVQLLPMENVFSRYRAVHSDHETFMLARRWEKGRGWISMLWRKNAGWKRRTVKIKLWKWRIFREPKLDALILINILRSHTFLIIKNYRVIF